MDEPISQQDEPEKRTVTPAEVWDQLSPDVRTRVLSLLARMTYKYVLTEYGSLFEVSEKDTTAEV